jgi:LDH2 family malate/lactate/ureidoglycolate dehydrogenase
MRGNDQGIVKLIGKGIPRHRKSQTPTIEKETPTTAMINANLSMEAVAMEQAVNMVIGRAKKMGIAIGMQRFIEETTKMTTAIKQAKKLEGVEEVMVLGERGDRV